jgi:gluconate 2-dehydrogenase gamma chain
LLTDTQTQTLRAAVQRIIPADDDPGAWQAGGGEFFHRLLMREPQFLPTYRYGLDALEAEAQADGGDGFSSLTPDAQDALLARVEAGEVRADWPLDPAAFFRLLVEQTTESFYADPGNGGNTGGVAWAMMGYRVTA